MAGQLPRDLLTEVEAELDAELVELRLAADRVSALAELRGIAVAEAMRRGRRVTAADVLHDAPHEEARMRLLLLLRRLRGGRGLY